MNPVGEPRGKKWVITSHPSEIQGHANVQEWWTGTSWVNVERLALEFNSEVDVNWYIERNRPMLEPDGQS